MNEKTPGRFVSDWIEVDIDEPGDRTVRPIPPGPRLEQAKALRDRIRAAEAAGVDMDECIEVVLDGPGDHTVRPIPPGPRLEQAKALRDLIRQVEAERIQKAKDNGQH